MKKTKLFLMGILSIALVFGFISCGDEPQDNPSGNDGKFDPGGNPGNASVITISGKFAGAVIEGQAVPMDKVRITVHYNWEGYSVTPAADGSWSFPHKPFNADTGLWFSAVIPTGENTAIEWQFDGQRTIKAADVSGITLAAVNIPTLITVSGTASTTIDEGSAGGAYDKGVAIINTSIQGYDSVNSQNHPAEGWTSASAGKLDTATNDWAIKVPSSADATSVDFSVALSYLEDANGVSGYGRKNYLGATSISSADKSGIELGTVDFVLLSGNFDFKVNEQKPFRYTLDFGKYGAETAGWTGNTHQFSASSNGAWAAPAPKNIDLDVEVVYWKDSYLERANFTAVSINTGDSAKSVDLSEFKNCTERVLSGTVGAVTLDDQTLTDHIYVDARTVADPNNRVVGSSAIVDGKWSLTVRLFDKDARTLRFIVYYWNSASNDGWHGTDITDQLEIPAGAGSITVPAFGDVELN